MTTSELPPEDEVGWAGCARYRDNEAAALMSRKQGGTVECYY